MDAHLAKIDHDITQLDRQIDNNNAAIAFLKAYRFLFDAGRRSPFGSPFDGFDFKAFLAELR